MSNIQSVTFSVSTTGDLVNRQFPQALITSTYVTEIPIAVLGCQLASSSLNPVAAGIVGVYAGKAVSNTTTIRVDGSSDVWLSHIYHQNASSVSQTSATGFGDVNLMLLDSQMGMSIYLSTPNDVTALVSATLTIWFAPTNTQIVGYQSGGNPFVAIANPFFK